MHTSHHSRLEKPSSILKVAVNINSNSRSAELCCAAFALNDKIPIYGLRFRSADHGLLPSWPMTARYCFTGFLAPELCSRALCAATDLCTCMLLAFASSLLSGVRRTIFLARKRLRFNQAPPRSPPMPDPPCSLPGLALPLSRRPLPLARVNTTQI